MSRLEDLLEHMSIDGWCVIDGVIPPGEVEAVRSSVVDSVRKHNIESERQNLLKVSGLINFNQSFAPYLAEPRLLGLCKALLGEDVRVSFTTSTVLFPGNDRGGWHADWPFNQQNAGHIPAPYPDAVAHLTTIWMLSAFKEDSGTYVVSGSHKENNNPTGGNGVPADQPHPTESRATGEPGAVLVMDSRIWHAIGANRSDEPRVAIINRFAPWWLNLDVLLPGSDERRRLVDERGANDNITPPVPPDVFQSLPNNVKPLFSHWVRPQLS